MPVGELVFIFATSLGVGFSGAVTPGPLLTVTVAESARRGFRAGPLLVLGHGILELALLVGLWLGLARVLSDPSVIAIVGAIGGVALIVFGALMTHAALARRISLHAPLDVPWARLHPVGAGLVASVSNPFWIIWWATIGLAYVTRAAQLGLAGAASFFTGHILSDLIWFSAVAFIVASGRRFMGDRAYQVVIGLCGAFLVGLGAFFVVSGATALAA